MIPLLPFPPPPISEYIRMMEQRRTMENHRGASKSCIERNTFPHKFKKIPREKPEDEEEEEADKCTICLSGMKGL